MGALLNITPSIIRGEELLKKGFGGIYGVGKAALVPPALAVLSYMPSGATTTIAWVGKGIVYDTGGLSIKGKVKIYPYVSQMKLLTIFIDCHARHEKRLWWSSCNFGSFLCNSKV